MRVWITKYALTEGIIEGEAAKDAGLRGHITLLRTGHWEPVNFPMFHKGEWSATEQEAVEAANRMVAKKIKSLEKSLAKYRQMEFVVGEKP